MRDFVVLREQAGLELEDVASEFSAPEEVVALWEQGTVRPPDNVMRSLDLLASFRPAPATDPSVQSSLHEALSPRDFQEEIKEFTFNGQRTRTENRAGIPFFVNEFWTARQRQGHSIHEVSYRACFKPQLPEFFISRFTRRGETVYDPFMGRGTTPIQAVLMGRKAIGNDINPLSICLTRPRTMPPEFGEVAARLRSIDWSGDAAADHDLLAFYHRDTLREILALRRYLQSRERAGTIDPVDEWIRMVALNRLTGHSSGFFSVYSLPPNQAVSVASQRRINEKRNQIPPRRHVPEIIARKTNSLLKDRFPTPAGDARFLTRKAENSGLADASIDLVVTSPPFLDIVQYASDNWLRCWFAGIDPESVSIAMHKKPAEWTSFVRNVFVDLERIVRSGGHVCFEVGEIRNGRLLLEELVIDAVESLRFDLLGVVVNDQMFTKTANCWGVQNNKSGTNSNRIVVLKRQ